MATTAPRRPRNVSEKEKVQPQQQQQQHEPAEAPKTNATTRICLKNVPPSVQQVQQVKDFLLQSQKSYFPPPRFPALTITDCQILPKRRMAFVGFPTKECAAACVQFLNGSYWKTSKLVVEFAFPKKQTEALTSPAVVKGDALESKADVKKVLSTKAQKKKEFLDLMVGGTGATKGNFWSNDDEGASTQVDEVVEEKDSEKDTESESEVESDEDNAEPLKAVTPKAMSDMDFLRLKTVGVAELPEEAAVDGGENDNASSSSDEVVDMKADEQQATTVVDDAEVHVAESLPEVSSKRLFVRNLPFTATEDDLSSHFSHFGTLEECHVPADDQHRSKGFGFVSFQDAGAATAALEASDGNDFQGRIIHVLPARAAKTSEERPVEGATYKEKQELEKQRQAGKDQTGWSASFVRGDAVVDNLATRLGLKKGDVLGVKDGLSAGDAAVRMALGETAIIEENRKYFAAHGIDMEALVSLSKGGDSMAGSVERSKVSFLVKNLPADTTKDELLKTFGSTGVNPLKILLPPSRTIAVIEYAHPNESKKVFKKLAYRRFRSVPLYLEWAPLAAKVKESAENDKDSNPMEISEEADSMAVEDTFARGARPTLYVKNLNFSTSEDELAAFFATVTSKVSVRIPQKVGPAKRVGGKVVPDDNTRSMGFGFVEFGSKDAALAALEQLQGKMLAGHPLQLEPTKESSEMTSTASSKKKSSKLMVRNVPFQANRKELLTLFGSFGQLKKVRLPKKFDGNHRGFAFVDYVSSKEAAEAMKTLSRTHLYGRHLVIEWAEDETEPVDDERERIPAELAQPVNKKIRFT
jgi:multiple RNA-binding domain-containing protein 1